MNIKDYSIIETQFIDNWIQILSDKIKSASEEPLTGLIYSIDNWTKEKELLIKLKLKLKPLIPIVKDAFDAGLQRGWSGYPDTDNHTKPKKQDYINNTIIE